MPVRVDINAEAEMTGVAAEDARAIVAGAVQAVLAYRAVSDAEISVTLLDDDRMAALNREWKGRDAPTDVLAFSLYSDGESPLGDVYVGVDRAVEQSQAAGESPARELARLAIHGTLHVLGLDHPEEDREQSDLWRHQERILRGLELE
jgi:probable rRNA maturation factor